MTWMAFVFAQKNRIELMNYGARKTWDQLRFPGK